MSSSKGLVGLAISYALSVTDRLSGMVTSFTETEKQMVSVERAVQYIEDVQPEISPRGMVSINNKWLVFTSSNLLLPWPGAKQDTTRVKRSWSSRGQVDSLDSRIIVLDISFSLVQQFGEAPAPDASKAFNELLCLYDLRKQYCWVLQS